MSKNKSLTWDLSALYKSDTDPKIQIDKKKLKQAAQDFAKKWSEDDSYLTDPKKLLEALEDYDKWLARYGTSGNIGFYFSLRQAQNMSDPKLKAELSKINQLSNDTEDLMRFFTHKLAKIPNNQKEIFLKDEDLTPFHYFLRRLFEESDHILSDREEKIINRKIKPAYQDWVQLTGSLLAQSKRTVLDHKGRKAEKNFTDILALLSHTQTRIRDRAALAFNDILAQSADVAEAEINSVLYNKLVDDELRGFGRPESERFISDDVPEDTVDALIKTVKNNFHLSKQYYELKSELLGVSTLKYHERNVPVGKIKAQIPWSEAVNIVKETFARLDPELEKIFDSLIAGGQIDVDPRANKMSGAFCASNLITSPTFILLNYTGELRDVLTLAHEAGHAVHNELMRKHVKPIYFSTSLTTAEVASIFFEDFALRTLTEKLSSKNILFLKMEKLNDDISTVFRQVAAFRFEQELHKEFRKQGHLSKEFIGQLFKKHMSSYMGQAVEQSPGSENWWIYWRHFRTFFYVYSYASGSLIAKALQEQVQENPEKISLVKNCLEQGASRSPLEIFASAGLDPTKASFWQLGLKQIKKQLTEIRSDLNE